MAKLTRKTSVLFAGNYQSAPNNQLGVFGSLAQGSPAYSGDPAQIQTTQFYDGWSSAVVGTNQPALEDINSLFYVLSYYVNYFNQMGIPEWDSGTTYYTNSYVNNTNSANGPVGIYVSLIDNNTQILSNQAAWATYQSTFSGPNLCKAWVCFSGTNVVSGNCVVSNAYNVSSVQYISTGKYQINFATPLPSNNYTFAGSAGTPDGFSSVPGDNNIIAGAGPQGSVAVRTASALQVYCWEPNRSGVGALEDSQLISVQVFGS